MIMQRPDVYVLPALEWWEVVFLTAGGAAAVLLLQAAIAAVPELWADALDWWRGRRRKSQPLRGIALVDRTAEDPSTFDADDPHPTSILVFDTVTDHDKAWRALGRVPAIPEDLPARWGKSRVGLHFVGCRTGVKTDDLPEILSWQQAADYAADKALRPCHVCKPLDQIQLTELAPT